MLKVITVAALLSAITPPTPAPPNGDYHVTVEAPDGVVKAGDEVRVRASLMGREDGEVVHFAVSGDARLELVSWSVSRGEPVLHHNHVAYRGVLNAGELLAVQATFRVPALISRLDLGVGGYYTVQRPDSPTTWIWQDSRNVRLPYAPSAVFLPAALW